MSSFEIYLLFVLLPNFGILCAIICSLSMLLSILALVDSKKDDRKYGIIFLFIGVISGLVCFCIPSKKDMAIIYLAPKIINNQVVQQIPAEIMKFIDKEIEDKDSE